MSVVIVVNGRTVYQGTLGTGRGALTITVRCRCLGPTHATVVYAGDALMVEEVGS